MGRRRFGRTKLKSKSAWKTFPCIRCERTRGSVTNLSPAHRIRARVRRVNFAARLRRRLMEAPSAIPHTASALQHAPQLVGDLSQQGNRQLHGDRNIVGSCQMQDRPGILR